MSTFVHDATTDARQHDEHVVRAVTPMVLRDADATPAVRFVAHLLELSLRFDDIPDADLDYLGTVVLRSASDHQCATIVASARRLRVTHGVAPLAEANATVDFASRQVGSGLDDRRRHIVNRMLNAPLPAWWDLVDDFAAVAAPLRDMPSLRLVDIESGESRTVDAGADIYEIHGTGARLQGFLAGTEFFTDVVYAGGLRIRGSFSQFSIVSGASMKVMWDV